VFCTCRAHGGVLPLEAVQNRAGEETSGSWQNDIILEVKPEHLQRSRFPLQPLLSTFASYLDNNLPQMVKATSATSKAGGDRLRFSLNAGSDIIEAEVCLRPS